MSLQINTEINLLPCPFCGGKGALTLGVRRDAVKTVDVICQDCSGAMLAFCEDDAIADWNTRQAASQGSACVTTCKAAARDGVTCPDDSCDIEDGVRPASQGRAGGGRSVALADQIHGACPHKINEPPNCALVTGRLECVCEHVHMHAIRASRLGDPVLSALVDLHSVARVDRDEDYAAVTNAAAVIEAAISVCAAQARTGCDKEATFGEDGYNPAYDNGITFAIVQLAELTGSKDWQMRDGSEDHDTDVRDTIMDVLKCAGIYDDETGKFVALAQASPDDSPHYLGAIRLRLEELYVKSDDPREREQISDEVDWITDRIGARDPSPVPSAEGK